MTLTEDLVAVADRAAALDVRALSGTEVLDLAATLTSTLARLTGVRLACLQSVADTGAWGLDGSRSMPWALARREDAGIASVRAEVTLAERLSADLPLTAAALRAGEVSLDKAKLLARLAPTSTTRRAALRDPECGEAFLLGKARDLDVWGLTRAVRYWGYRVDPDKDDRDYREDTARFELRIAGTLEGGDVRGLLSPETTELLRTALRAIIGVPSATDRRSTPQRYADALGDLARFFLDAGTCGGGKVKPHLNVSVGWDAFTDQARSAGVDPAVFVETGQPIPRTVFDRIACDSEVTRVVFGPDSEPLDVGRAQRTVTPAQRRAVIARDQTCRGPGCHAPPRLCEVHHLVWWTRGGVTSVENSGLLCWRCHDWVHTHDITITHHNRDLDLHPPRRTYLDPRTRPAHRLTKAANPTPTHQRHPTMPHANNQPSGPSGTPQEPIARPEIWTPTPLGELRAGTAMSRVGLSPLAREVRGWCHRYLYGRTRDLAATAP